MNPEADAPLSLEDRLSLSESKVSEISASLGSALSDVETLSREKAALEAEKAALAEKVTAAAAEAEVLKARVAALEAEAVSASERAAKIVAASGLPAPVAATPAASVETSRSRESLIEELSSITDPKAKADFFNRYSAILIGR